MKKYFAFLAVIALAVLASCEPDKPAEEEKPVYKTCTFSITSEDDVANLDEYAGGISALKNLSDEYQTMVTSMLHSNFDAEKSVHVYRYTYPSIDPDGNQTTLSSVLMVPADAITSGARIKNVVLANHFSYMKNSECPTLSNNIEGLLAWNNAAVVMPDYYGFGASSDKMQAYLNPDVTAAGSLDALLAAQALMKDKSITCDSLMFNVGYSQGGFNAIANLKYLSTHSEYDIHFEETVAGGGPYNVMDTFKSYLGGGYDSVFPLVLLTLVSFNETAHLGIDYADIFKEPLLSKYKEYILSKNYSTSEVISLLGSTVATDHLTADLTSMSGPVFEKFAAVADQYSLTKGWTPSDWQNITLIHSEADDMVPFSNYEALVSFLSGKCTLSKLYYSFGSHVTTYIQFLLTANNCLAE